MEFIHIFSEEPLDCDGDALAAADAERRDAPAAAGPPQPIEQGDDDPRPAAADRVAQGDGSAVDVDLLGVEAGLLLDREADRREGLIDLEEVDVADTPAGPVEELLDGADPGQGKPLRLAAEGHASDDSRLGLEPEL